MVTQRFQPGDYVTYSKGNGQCQLGRVKTMNDDGTHAFVVYHCADDWDNYRDYTGGLTECERLTPGWPYPNFQKI